MTAKESKNRNSFAAFGTIFRISKYFQRSKHNFITCTEKLKKLITICAYLESTE